MDMNLKKSYSLIFIYDEESERYTAKILEFPGCITEGDNLQQAYDNLQEAAKGWVESALCLGQKIPEPGDEPEVEYPTVRVVNHFYKLYNLDDKRRDNDHHWEEKEQLVKVLSLHLNKGTMRVRGKIWNEKKQKETPFTWDMSIDPFFEKYLIKKRG